MPGTLFQPPTLAAAVVRSRLRVAPASAVNPSRVLRTLWNSSRLRRVRLGWQFCQQGWIEPHRASLGFAHTRSVTGKCSWFRAQCFRLYIVQEGGARHPFHRTPGRGCTKYNRVYCAQNLSIYSPSVMLAAKQRPQCSCQPGCKSMHSLRHFSLFAGLSVDQARWGGR